MTACVFCDVASGKTDAATVFQDDRVVAFLDHRPLFKGHVLLIPRLHVETLADLPAALVPHVFMTAQRLCKAVERACNAKGTFVAMNNRVSQSVPHLHVHVVPRNPKDGLKGFFWPRTTYLDTNEMRRVASEIAALMGE